jgi:leucyl aminopeptidase
MNVALFTNNETLLKKTRCRRFSRGAYGNYLWDVYKQDIERYRRCENYSGKPVAGAISAAKFLEYFTKEHTAWAHLMLPVLLLAMNLQKTNMPRMEYIY